MKVYIKALAIIFILSSCFLTVLVGSGVFTYYYVKGEVETSAEDFFAKVPSLDSQPEQLEKTKTSLDRVLELADLEIKEGAGNTEEISELSENSLKQSIQNLELFYSELDSENPPTLIRGDVNTAKKETQNVIKDLERINSEILYMGAISSMLSDFSKEIDDSIIVTTSPDPYVALSEYNQNIANFDTIFKKYKEKLDTIEVPTRMNQYHGLVEGDINSRYKTLITFYEEGRSVLQLHIQYTENPSSASSQDISNLNKRKRDYVDTSKTLTDKFTQDSYQYDFKFIFSNLDYQQLKNKIDVIIQSVESMQAYRDFAIE